MNKHFLISISSILILGCCFYAKSQNLKLFYNLEFVKDTITKNTEKRNMVLWVESQNYIFCSEGLLIKDSLKSNNLEYSPVLMNEEVEFMTIKKENLVSMFSFVDENLYIVHEDFANLKWKIKNELRKIGNIECQLATLDYKGRIWNAWFSTKYPISIGPYIFNGLPGAIIELTDTKQNYIFKLSEIKTTKEDINKLLNQKIWITKKPIVLTKEKLKKVYLSSYSDPYKKMKDRGIVYMIDEKTGERQPPPDFIKMTKSAQKYILDNNNPIELSEAIKYLH